MLGAQVPRRKGETISGRYRRNGYVHQQEIGRLSGRHREQARLPHGFGYIRKRQAGCQAAFAGKLPQSIGVHPLNFGKQKAR
jgi:hypothetical protein